MIRSHIATLSMLQAIAATVGSAAAQDRIQVGTLVCNTWVNSESLSGRARRSIARSRLRCRAHGNFTEVPSPSSGLIWVRQLEG
jgi:hypothetical protein